MDSLTQIALGAAVGEAVLGRKVGYRAALWGGICGTIPDLDVLIPFGDAVKDFTYHRGFSHSLFVLTLLSPLLVWLILKLHPHTAAQRRGWFALVFLALITHPLLDCFTVYGTQIFWPFYNTPMTWSTIFIIDPLYTLPLIIGVLAALSMRRHRAMGHKLNTIGLLLSTLYLSWSLAAKLYVDAAAGNSLAQQNIPSQKLLSTPAPFNTLLWRIVVMDNDRYYEGFYSFLDDDGPIRFKAYPSTTDLLTGIEAHWPVQRLQWFTKGFYSVSRGPEDDDVVITDLRMGVEPDYVFRFKVAEIGNPHAEARAAELLPPARNWRRVARIWQRIWDQTIEP